MEQVVVSDMMLKLSRILAMNQASGQLHGICEALHRCLTLSCKIKGGPVIRTGAHMRQTERDIYGVVKINGF